MTRTDLLDALFARWLKSYPGEEQDFVMDGIIDEAAWARAPRRVAFLLKESNSNNPAGGPKGFDLRKYLGSLERPWDQIGRWAFGLQHASADQAPAYEEADLTKHLAGACHASAIINLKKIGGGGSAYWPGVLRFVNKDAEFIRQELEIIEPDIVLCGGTAEAVKLIFPESSEVRLQGRCLKMRGRIWIGYFHPQARRSQRDLYDSLVRVFQSFLRDG